MSWWWVTRDRWWEGERERRELSNIFLGYLQCEPFRPCSLLLLLLPFAGQADWMEGARSWPLSLPFFSFLLFFFFLFKIFVSSPFFSFTYNIGSGGLRSNERERETISFIHLIYTNDNKLCWAMLLMLLLIIMMVDGWYILLLFLSFKYLLLLVEEEEEV